MATILDPRGETGFDQPTLACGRALLRLRASRPIDLASCALVLVLAASLTGCVLQGKKRAAQATPAAPAPAAKPSTPPRPLSIPQTQVEIPTPQPVSEEALAAGQTAQDAPEPATPPRPVHHNVPPPAANPRPEAPPVVTEEPARAPIQEVLSLPERKQLQDSTAERKREIRRLVDLARSRRLNSHELSVVARIEGLVRLSGDAEAKGDLREADGLAQRALVLARDLDSER
ncbi:MAG: hypothetical protein ACLQKA_14225 [Bryobacteraceae bacterium]